MSETGTGQSATAMPELRAVLGAGDQAARLNQIATALRPDVVEASAPSASSGTSGASSWGTTATLPVSLDRPLLRARASRVRCLTTTPHPYPNGYPPVPVRVRLTAVGS